MCTYSIEHQKYLNRIKREKIIVFFVRVFIILFFLILWEFLSDNNFINSFMFSSPFRILSTIINLVKSGDLFIHIKYTMYEVLLSFFISSIIGFMIAVIMWSNTILYKIVDPYITILNSLPKVALGPLIIIWVGASTNSIIFMALLINLFITIVGIYNGFISVNQNYITMLKSFGASRYQIFTKVIFPSNYLNIISTLKINISMSLIGVIMGELLVSKYGIGYLIMYGSQIFNIDLILSGVFILGIISYFMYFFISKIENFLKRNH